MFEDSTVIRLALASILIGFATYCVSYTVLIWRRRNATSNDKPMPFRGIFLAGIVLGLGLLSIGLIQREAIKSDGVVSGENLFAVRGIEQGQIVELANKGAVKAGDLLARFDAPHLNAELAELRIRESRLTSEVALLNLQPLPLNLDLIREQHTHVFEKGNYISSADHLLSARETVMREPQLQILNKQEEIVRVEGFLQTNKHDVEQTVIRHGLSIRNLNRERQLLTAGATTAHEVDKRAADVRTSDLELTKLRNRDKSLEAERSALQQSIKKLEELIAAQHKVIDARFQDSLEGDAKLTATRGSFEERLAKDRQRAVALREAEKKTLTLQAAESKARRQALEQQLAIYAPYAGHVVFRTSFSTVPKTSAAVVVFAPENAFRFRARIPASQVEALREAGHIPIEVTEGLPGLPERMFLARLHGTPQPLPAEPGMVAVDLACDPPAEIVRALAEGDKIKVRLAWRAPLTAVTTAKYGLVLIAFGVLGLLLRRIGSAIPARDSLPHEEVTGFTPTPLPQVALLDNGISSNGYSYSHYSNCLPPSTNEKVSVPFDRSAV